MNNRYDLIIFDWDGTLMNSIDWIVFCLQQAAKLCQCPVPDEQAAKDVIGLSIEVAMDTLFPEADGMLRKQLVAQYSQVYSSREISREDLFPGVYDMLVQLQQNGYQLAVATGKNRRGLVKALAATGTGDLFGVTRCADETASKPNPKMVYEILKHTQVTNQRALLVGDSIHDLQMALNAEVAAIGVACGVHSEDRLKQYQPLLCIQQSTQLIDIIGG
ncbi:MAG: HAD-IIIA family hydrolase [Methylococcaceae bacterium]|jgi:phosphoglycolate phosphatase